MSSSANPNTASASDTQGGAEAGPVVLDSAVSQSAGEHRRRVSALQASPSDIQNFDQLEVDELDTDSTLGDELESITTSISSTVTDYKFEHGRRYHAFADGRYVLPNDDDEIKRLELQHRIWRVFLSDRPGLAPISPNPRTALDIGCGTGAWAIDFAEAHPSCHVTGTDLSPIQPLMVPTNVEFLVDDITSDWLYPTKFDYIHSRSLQVGIKDWNKLISEVWTHLEPGGWIEFQEYHWPFTCDDGTIAEFGPNFKLWNDGIKKASEKAGTRLDAILGAPDLLREKGFVNVEFLGSKWPVGAWPKGKREKRIGALFMQDMLLALEGVSMRMFTKLLGWKSEDVFQLIKDIERELKEGKMHIYFPIDFVWAQKSFDAPCEPAEMGLGHTDMDTTTG